MKRIDWKNTDLGFVYWIAFLCMVGAVVVSLIAVMGKMLMFMAISPNW